MYKKLLQGSAPNDYLLCDMHAYVVSKINFVAKGKANSHKGSI